MYIGVEITLAIAILAGIRLMSSPRTAAYGNRLAAMSLLAAILLILLRDKSATMPCIFLSLAAGGVLGVVLAWRVTMLQMPQLVAMLNGLGGAASMLTAFVAVSDNVGAVPLPTLVTGGLAIIVGGITLSGSLVAAGKLHRILPQQPLRTSLILRLTVSVPLFLMYLLGLFSEQQSRSDMSLWMLFVGGFALIAGPCFTLPVGGADMPITISLLNSLSGVAASICGFVVDSVFLVSAGAIVGAAGLILTRVMCRAMNRSLLQVLTGRTVALADASIPKEPMSREASPPAENFSPAEPVEQAPCDPVESLLEAKKIIFVPGYGMALGEAETQLRDLYDLLESQGKDVKFAIHPVAGRMPGHMTVLLADVDIPYGKMIPLEKINHEFAETDVALVVGACDVVNPAAITAVGTPIYGMPILQAHEAKHIIVCNADTKPGYSGIENPLYKRDNVCLLLGNASSTLDELLKNIKSRLSAQK